MHTKHVIEEVDAAGGSLLTQSGIRFILANPVPEFVSGWAPGVQIWATETEGEFNLCSASEMLEIVSARIR